MMPGDQRAEDLRRDPRVALHCPTEDPPDDDPAGWLGDGKIAAVVTEVQPHRLQLGIDQVVRTRVAAGAQELEITRWRPYTGVRAVRRAARLRGAVRMRC